MGRKLGCLGDEGGARAQSRIESRWQENGEGLGSLAAEPRSPAPKTWEYEPSTVAEIGQIPETPPGVPTGFGLAASGGMLPKLASGQRGSGGVLSNSR
jgi:hypothetical protein